jgi:hypothetical protein
MAGELPAASVGHSRKGIYVLLAWALLLQCAFTGLQWQSLLPHQQQHVIKQQQPAAGQGHAAHASPSDRYFKPMAGEYGLCAAQLLVCCLCNPTSRRQVPATVTSDYHLKNLYG